MKAYRIIGLLILIVPLQSPFTVRAESAGHQEALSLKSGHTGVAFSTNPESHLQRGYAIVTVHDGSVPFANAVMSYTRDGVVISEVVVSPSAPTLSARLFVDFRTDVPSGSGSVDVNTGISLVNMGTRTAQISLLLRNLQGDSTPIAFGTLDLDEKAHVSKFINQFDPDFVLPPSFSSTIGFGSLEIASDQPISIHALRMTINQRGEPLFTNMPIADLKSSLETSPLNFPQIADGGGYQTTLLLVNTSDVQESGTLYFFKSDGSPYKVRLHPEEEAVSQHQYTIQANGALRILTDGAPSETTAGWVQLVPSKGVTPAGVGILGYHSHGILVSEFGAPPAASTTHARMFIDCSSNRETGLAIVASGNHKSAVTLRAYQSDGTADTGIIPAEIQLSAYGHYSAFANQLFSELPSEFTGILDLQSSTPFAALELRSFFNSRNDFLITAFPVADYDSPSSDSIVIPQITTGDGYQTEMLFLNTGDETRATLNIFEEEGAVPEILSDTTRPE
jgi:hypothetical protein